MSNLEDFRNPPPLTHLKRLTTREGLVQHADMDVPDPSHGYSLDDNARAIIATLWYYNIYKDPSVLRLLEIYFSYIKKVEKEGGSFHNFLSFTEQILDAEGSEDSIGRTIWALGEMIRTCPNEALCNESKSILEKASIHRHLDHPHVRTKAYILLGLLAADQKEEATRWADKLVETYKENTTNDWRWFENYLSYANATLPYALAEAGRVLENKTYIDIAKESLTWLDSVSRIANKPAPIGQAGWYIKNGIKAEYDQQPLDTSDMILAFNALYKATNNSHYLDKALEWMGWYRGNNSQNISVIHETNNGVYDAVTPGGINKNQGAESIVTYLMAYLSLGSVENR
ncbi:MAG: hypothetical protein NUV80_05835 [Candidatus Berkelbacteria bacterium]|nr:hypothetical protein [Candidatus Berkelbacteria bacterium]MCR4308055.1 hypothetical protein [Candidatus Berkelbacteria bacterium]